MGLARLPCFSVPGIVNLIKSNNVGTLDISCA